MTITAASPVSDQDGITGPESPVLVTSLAKRLLTEAQYRLSLAWSLQQTDSEMTAAGQAQFAALHLLMHIMYTHPDTGIPHLLAAQITSAWADSDSLGEWLHDCGRELDVDTTEITRMAEDDARRHVVKPCIPDDQRTVAVRVDDLLTLLSHCGLLPPRDRRDLNPVVDRVRLAVYAMTRNAGLPVTWDDSVPGGFVCAVPDPDHPGRHCGSPVESGPCREHSPAGRQPE